MKTSHIPRSHNVATRQFSKRLLIVLGFLIIIPAGMWIVLNRPASDTKVETINQQRSNTTSVSVTPIGKKALLPGTKWVPQSFNNCGPAATSMILGYFGYDVNQNETKSKLRTNDDDKNVFLYEIQDYIKKEYNLESKIFYNGTIETLKRLLANGFYVVVEDWLHPNEDIGHVLIIRGYDDTKGVLIADDSYFGINIEYPYQNWDQTQWKAFNREYMPIYKSNKEPLLKAIVGSDYGPKTMYKNSVQFNMADIKNNSNDMYAWFNLGTSFYGLGEYKHAKDAFDKSRSIGWPKRMLWYQIHPVKTENALGNYQQAIELANIGLWSNDSFAELHVELAIAYKGLGDTAKAKEEIDKALLYAPNVPKAQEIKNSLQKPE
jgi:tetratricopeptide (TPR) repeat protein